MDKAKDFEKGWEEHKAKKKQEIEELGQDIYDNCPDLCENGCGGKPCYKCIAEALHRDNYRKIPENAVVLTREEYNNMQFVMEFIGTKQKIGACDFNRVFLQHERKIRKETAEKFAERLKEAVSDISFKASTVGFDGYQSCSAVNPNSIIERIDEIAKEFTEARNAKNE